MSAPEEPTSDAPVVGLFGGSFDPIHFGHLISARSVAEHLGIDRIVLIPAAQPPHKTGRVLASFEHRLQMTRLAVGDDPLFDVSDIEAHRPGPSYTIDTVIEFRRRLPDSSSLAWLIGADSLPELATWRRISDLLDRVRIVTMSRPVAGIPDMTGLVDLVGERTVARLLADRIDTPQIDISATNIRARVARNQSVRYLLPDALALYIDEHRLYRESSSPATRKPA